MKSSKILDILEAKFNEQLQGARKYAESDEDAYNEVHEWLQQFTQGQGLDIAAGNFPSIGAVAIDHLPRLGNLIDGYLTDATNLTSIDSNSQDYVVTNYLDGIETTLKALNEWHRVLRPQGILAIVVPNGEYYPDAMGPLANRRKFVVFTPMTLYRYLERANYAYITVAVKNNRILANARKP